MSVRLLQRQLAPVQALQPGQYTTETASGRPAVCCPECGGISEIEQTPRDNGDVPLRWACPYACPYTAILKLEDFGEAVLR